LRIERRCFGGDVVVDHVDDRGRAGGGAAGREHVEGGHRVRTQADRHRERARCVALTARFGDAAEDADADHRLGAAGDLDGALVRRTRCVDDRGLDRERGIEDHGRHHGGALVAREVDRDDRERVLDGATRRRRERDLEVEAAARIGGAFDVCRSAADADRRSGFGDAADARARSPSRRRDRIERGGVGRDAVVSDGERDRGALVAGVVADRGEEVVVEVGAERDVDREAPVAPDHRGDHRLRSTAHFEGDAGKRRARERHRVSIRERGRGVEHRRIEHRRRVVSTRRERCEKQERSRDFGHIDSSSKLRERAQQPAFRPPASRSGATAHAPPADAALTVGSIRQRRRWEIRRRERASWEADLGPRRAPIELRVRTLHARERPRGR
jgi:hypothetical protein